MADGSAPILLADAAGLGPIDVVYFAGAGGSSEAYRMALGHHPHVAINHSPVALSVHQVNFPDTDHYVADVFDVDPRKVYPARRWRSAWFSPDCRHFSKAKGGAPVSPRVRGLCWVVIKVAKLRQPDLIFLENVEEFQDYGPLLPNGKPDPALKGRTFRLWVKRLRQCGYTVEWRELVAADYGAPTTRKRLFVIARRDGLPIVWPEPTHAPRKVAASKGLRPWRPAADIIDWSVPCPSIFLTPEEARAIGVRRPLAPATMARIARGVFRYVIAHADPFMVPLTHQGDARTYDLADPLRTVTGANRGEIALVSPVLVPSYGERPPAYRCDACGEEFLDTYANGVGGLAPAECPRCGEEERISQVAAGQAPRSRSLEEPYPTVVPGGNGGRLAAVHLTKFSENSTGHLPDEPLHTVMAGAPRHGVVAAFLEQANTGMIGRDARAPVSTLVGKGCTQRVVTACMGQLYSSNTAGGEGDVREPARTVTAGGGHQYVLQAPLERPFNPRGEELRAFLIKYYGPSTGQDVADPLHSVTSRARFGLVTVAGQVLQISDIGMRMLTPAELAGAQGFPAAYVTGFNARGEAVSKTDQTLMIGNSVSPVCGAAIIAANLRTPFAPAEAA